MLRRELRIQMPPAATGTGELWQDWQGRSGGREQFCSGVDDKLMSLSSGGAGGAGSSIIALLQLRSKHRRSVMYGPVNSTAVRGHIAQSGCHSMLASQGRAWRRERRSGLAAAALGLPAAHPLIPVSEIAGQRSDMTKGKTCRARESERTTILLIPAAAENAPTPLRPEIDGTAVRSCRCRPPFRGRPVTVGRRSTPSCRTVGSASCGCRVCSSSSMCIHREQAGAAVLQPQLHRMAPGVSHRFAVQTINSFAWHSSAAVGQESEQGARTIGSSSQPPRLEGDRGFAPTARADVAASALAAGLPRPHESSS